MIKNRIVKSGNKYHLYGLGDWVSDFGFVILLVAVLVITLLVTKAVR